MLVALVLTRLKQEDYTVSSRPAWVSECDNRTICYEKTNERTGVLKNHNKNEAIKEQEPKESQKGLKKGH